MCCWSEWLRFTVVDLKVDHASLFEVEDPQYRNCTVLNIKVLFLFSYFDNKFERIAVKRKVFQAVKTGWTARIVSVVCKLLYLYQEQHL